MTERKRTLKSPPRLGQNKPELVTPDNLSQSLIDSLSYGQIAEIGYFLIPQLDKQRAADIAWFVTLLHRDIKREIHEDGEVVVFRLPSTDWQLLLKEVEKNWGSQASLGSECKGEGREK